MPIPLYVINLASDVARYENVMRQVETHDIFTVTRINAFRGSELPDYACHVLTGNVWSHLYKGTLGCFLSHLKAWEQVAAGSNDFALIVEDDVAFSNIEIIPQISISADCDIVFCNSRTAYPHSITNDSALIMRPVDPILQYIMSHGFAVGGDGYLLTKSGAKKLISYVTRDRLFSHVDLRLLAYCLAPGMHNADNYTGAAKSVVQMRQMYNRIHILNGFTMLPVIINMTKSLSSRQIEDNVGAKTTTISME